MPANLKLTAIVPRRAVVDVNAIRPRLQREMVSFTTDMIAAMNVYPPQKPTSYRRTGNLGRRWRYRLVREGVEAFNDAASGGTRGRTATRRRRARKPSARRPYAVYVQGPKTGPGPGTRQTRVMRGKGWRNITDESRRVFAMHRRAFVRIISGQ